MSTTVSTQNVLFFIWQLLVYYYYCTLHKLGLYEFPKPKPTILSLSDSYIAKRKQQFLSTYDNPANFNKSIEDAFYNKTIYKEIMETPNNHLEQYWKKRILLEHTPRGNVIMYYDAYKLGFVYYCDNASLPYSLINAVVMKYVTMFRCRDFFIDIHIKPETCDSPLIDLYKDDTQKKPEQKMPKLTSNAFAKLKNYRDDSATTSKPANPQKNDQKTTNTIIYQGKINNISITQSLPKPIPKPVSTIVFDTEPVTSYREYKKRMMQQQKQATIVNYVC